MLRKLATNTVSTKFLDAAISKAAGGEVGLYEVLTSSAASRPICDAERAQCQMAQASIKQMCDMQSAAQHHTGSMRGSTMVPLCTPTSGLCAHMHSSCSASKLQHYRLQRIWMIQSGVQGGTFWPGQKAWPIPT